VRRATAEADRLEALAKAQEEQVQELELEVTTRENAAREAEETFTEATAAMLAEYSSRHAEVVALEEAVASARQEAAAKRAENLELSRRSTELDRELRNCDQRIREAQEMLDRCSASHGGLDAELAVEVERCETLRSAAQGQGERFAKDVRRFKDLKARLLEVCNGSPTAEVADLMVEAEKAIIVADELREACEEVARNGVQPTALEEATVAPERPMSESESAAPA